MNLAPGLQDFSVQGEDDTMIDTSFPLMDLHRHLDGNVRLETILDIGEEHGIPLPADDVEGLRPYVQIVEPEPDVMTFIAKFKWMMEILVDPEACFRIAYENVEDAFNESLDYVELRFSPWFMAETHQLDPREVVEAVVDGVQSGSEEYDIRANLSPRCRLAHHRPRRRIFRTRECVASHRRAARRAYRACGACH
ncbi:MAG: hypothetical protein P8Z41_09915 [Anaerolineales bacterium]